jgi:hypothetical protein
MQDSILAIANAKAIAEEKAKAAAEKEKRRKEKKAKKEAEKAKLAERAQSPALRKKRDPAVDGPARPEKPTSFVEVNELLALIRTDNPHVCICLCFCFCVPTLLQLICLSFLLSPWGFICVRFICMTQFSGNMLRSAPRSKLMKRQFSKPRRGKKL